MLVNSVEDRIIAAIDARSGASASERETAKLLETFLKLSKRQGKARRRTALRTNHGEA